MLDYKQKLLSIQALFTTGVFFYCFLCDNKHIYII